ncbi:MAG: ABC transporter substrate-binding protein [Defluviitaleaceae bacterium]|nr:ABC transporter substrate-binding protein [Defluviitaleaceae bacterium]
MKKHRFLTILAMLAVSIFIAACAAPAVDEVAVDPVDPVVGGGNGDDNGVGPDETVVHSIHPALVVLDQISLRYPQAVNNPGPILQPGDTGNIIRAAQPTTTTFPGIFERTMQSEAQDGTILDLNTSAIVSLTPEFTWGTQGIALISFAPDYTWVQLDMQYDVYWHDGTPFTLDDLVFAYEIITHPDYTGIRFVPAHFFPIIVGVDEWRDGTADHISGLVLSNNNRTLRIYYTEPLPPGAQFGGSIWLQPTPRHWLEPVIEELGVANLADHARARHEAVGFGPWIIDTVVPGESVLFRANDNYHRGRPLADYLLFEGVHFDLVLSAMREGLFDVTIGFVPAANYEEHVLFNANNYTMASWVGPGQGFMYFRTGTMVPDEYGSLATPRDDNHPIQNLAIRRALSHAMDQELKAITIQNGLSTPAGNILNPFNARQHIDPNVLGFFFDLDLANSILDEAGFTERGPDGYRLNLDGSPMYFNFAANDNSFNQQAVPTYLQNWSNIGLDVRLYTGDLIEWNTFLDNVLLSDNWSETVHIFISNWSLGFNPAPHGLWGSRVPFNLSRHTSPTFDAILDDIASQDAWNPEFLSDAYYRWQVYMYENAVAAPMFWGVQIFAVNHRLQGYDLTRVEGRINIPEQTIFWGLTAPVAYVNTN